VRIIYCAIPVILRSLWLRPTRDEAAGKGMQQAKEYASILGLKFAYATNGLEILEFDYITGLERELAAFPTPVELWSRPKAGILTSNPACY